MQQQLQQAQALPMQHQYSYTQQPATGVPQLQPLLSQQPSQTSFSAQTGSQQQVNSFYPNQQPSNFMMRQSSFNSYQTSQEPALPEYKRTEQQARHEYSHTHSEMPQKLQLSNKKHSGTKEDMKKANHFLAKTKNQAILMYTDEEEDEMEQSEQNRQMYMQQQKREERKKQVQKLEGGQQRPRGRPQPATSHKMNYFEELGAKRESGDPSEEDVDIDYPDEESNAYEGDTYADEPRMARAVGTTDASSHSAYGGGQGRPYADEDLSFQPKPAVANRGNRGAMRLLQGL